MFKNKKGFNMIELAAVILISMLLMVGIAISASAGINNSRIDTVENEGRIFASDVETAFGDLGVAPLLDLADESSVTSYLHTLEEGYLHCTLDFDTLVIDTNTFTIHTQNLLDPWKNSYKIIYKISDENQPIFFIISAGNNQKFEVSGYATGNFDDDIITILNSRAGI